MPKGIVIMVVLLVLLVGGCVLLSKSYQEQPLRTIEINVASNAAG